MSIAVQRPQRWDVPFGDDMNPSAVKQLLTIEPFLSMDPSRFPNHCALPDILLNDARLKNYKAGDIIVREGDYGNSAFLILRGAVRVTLQSLPDEMLGRKQQSHSGWLSTLGNMLTGAKYPEIRRYGEAQMDDSVGVRSVGEDTRVFLQDVPGVLDEFNTLQIGAGEFFGEVSALSRNPRSATVFADTPTTVLEIRWQGLRELMRRDPALKQHVVELYRSNSLFHQLRSTPILRKVSDEGIREITNATEFESYGDFEWQSKYRKIQKSDSRSRIAAEPIICEEDHYTNGLVIIRSGFARLSRAYGHGDLTMAYLGKGQLYGLDELIYNANHDKQVPLQRTLRSVGYVDILRIPTHLIERHVLPVLPASTVKASIQSVSNALRETTAVTDVDDSPELGAIDTGFLEFIVENRLMNGTEAMLINTDRCTRCDDCVRACATTHDNNPRFIRHGQTYENWMIANACMQCVDPVCMIGCPTGAIGRDEGTGNVLINDMTCIGCSTCSNSCPYNNIRMVEVRGESGGFILDELTRAPIVKATKCDLCVDRWGGPACQAACPHDALVRIDMNDIPNLANHLAQ